jgi:hypothetical protein
VPPLPLPVVPLVPLVPIGIVAVAATLPPAGCRFTGPDVLASAAPVLGLVPVDVSEPLPDVIPGVVPVVSVEPVDERPGGIGMATAL